MESMNCNSCGAAFKGYDQLMLHKAKTHLFNTITVFECNLCQKTFDCKEKVTEHILDHLGLSIKPSEEDKEHDTEDEEETGPGPKQNEGQGTNTEPKQDEEQIQDTQGEKPALQPSPPKRPRATEMTTRRFSCPVPKLVIQPVGHQDLKKLNSCDKVDTVIRPATKYDCPFLNCNIKFGTFSDRAHHFESEHKTLECEKCHRSLTSRQGLKRHWVEVDCINSPRINKLAKKKKVQAKKQVQKSLTFKQSIKKCPFENCGQVFQRFMELAGHLSSIHDSVECQSCQIKLNSRLQLARHWMTKGCLIPGNPTQIKKERHDATSKAKIINAMNNSRTEKNVSYKCDLCPVLVCSKNALAVHLSKVHGKIICTKCNLVYNHIRTLTKHWSSKGCIKPVVESTFQEAQHQAFTNKKHEILQHRTQESTSYICPEADCARRFSGKNALDFHIKILHGTRDAQENDDVENEIKVNQQNLIRIENIESLAQKELPKGY